MDDTFSIGAPTADDTAAPDAAETSGDEFSIGAPPAPASKAGKKAATEPSAEAPAKADDTDYANMGWGEVGKRAIMAAPESAANLGKGIVNTVIHPIDTLNTFGDIGSGLVSKAKGWLGAEQDPEEKAKTESLVNAIGQHYSDVYGGLGSGDTSGLKKELATDPMSPLMDAATVLTGGEGALAKAPGMIGKAAEVAGKLGSAVDPVQNALRVAKVAAKPLTYPVKKIAPYMQAVSTGVPKNLLEIAGQAGATSDSKLSDAFKAAQNGSHTNEQTVGVIRQALDDIQSDHSQQYWAGKSQLGTQPLDWKPVTQALQDARKITRKTDAAGQTMIIDPKGDSILDDIQKEIHGDPNDPNFPGLINAAPGSPFHTAEGFDALKQKVGHLIYDRQVSGKTKAAVSGIYNGIKKSITDVYPDYEKLMEQSQQHIMEMKDLLSQAGKSSIPITKQFAKIMLSTRKGSDTLLQAVAKKDPRIPYLLAGHATADFLPNRLRTAIESPAALWAAVHNPAALIPAALATSPRAMGSLNYGLGKLSKLPGKASLKKGIALEQAGKLNEEADREARASGGQVKFNAQAEADRLIRMAEKAKSAHGKRTEPLLNQPDEVITRALAAANHRI